VHEIRGEYDVAFGRLTQGLALPKITKTAEGARLYLRGVSVFTRQANHNQAEEWCKKGIELAKQIGKQEGQEILARSYYLLGGTLVRKGELERSIDYCEKSLSLYKKLNDPYGQAQAHSNLATSFYYLDNWKAAIHHYHAALGFAEQIGYVEGQAREASNLGMVLEARGDLAEARQRYQQALTIAQRWGMTYGIALLHCNLGAVSAKGRDWDGATFHLKQSLALFEEIGSEESLAELFLQWAEISLGQKDPDTALAYAKRSLHYAQNYNMRLDEGSAWRVLGKVHRVRGELKSAKKALTSALKIGQELNKQHEIALVHLEMARLQLQEGEEKAGKELAQKASQVFADLGARLDLKEAEKLL
jgi:tetratricopeptide (TPR) repeat protein